MNQNSPDSPRTIDQYELLEEIGRGGTGTVHRARQASLDRDVVLKLLEAPSIEDHFEIRRRMKREVGILVRLSHPNLVALLDANWDHDPPFMVFEYVAGARDIGKILDQGVSNERAARSLVYGIARGLAFLHENGVFHRDLKPGNVLVDRTGTPRIIDFGLSRQILPDETDLTRPGQTFGTLNYMAPEQLETAAVDSRADIYSFGLVACELLAGKYIFGGSTSPRVPWTQRLTGAPPLGELIVGLDPVWAQGLQTCLEVDPRRRPPSMESFLESVGLKDGSPSALDLLKEIQAIPPPPAENRNPGAAASKSQRPTRPDMTRAVLPPFGEVAKPMPGRLRIPALVAGFLGIALLAVWWSRGPAPSVREPTSSPAGGSEPEWLASFGQSARRLAAEPEKAMRRLESAAAASNSRESIGLLLTEWGLDEERRRAVMRQALSLEDHSESSRSTLIRSLLMIQYLDAFTTWHRLPPILASPVEDLLPAALRQSSLPLEHGWTYRTLPVGRAIKEGAPARLPIELDETVLRGSSVIFVAGARLYPEFLVWVELDEGARLVLQSRKSSPYSEANQAELADRRAVVDAARHGAFPAWTSPEGILGQEGAGILARRIPTDMLHRGTNTISISILQILGERHLEGPVVWQAGLAIHPAPW